MSECECEFVWLREQHVWVLWCPVMCMSMSLRVPGATSPYFYFGMWKALFGVHTEDMDMYSINFLHYGKPKYWYSVPPAQAARFDTVAASYYPEDAQICKQFLRHKTCKQCISLCMYQVGCVHSGACGVCRTLCIRYYVSCVMFSVSYIMCYAVRHVACIRSTVP